ncbi:hypothetical protein D3C72_1797390 [compost metagenome]
MLAVMPRLPRLQVLALRDTFTRKWVAWRKTRRLADLVLTVTGVAALTTAPTTMLVVTQRQQLRLHRH